MAKGPLPKLTSSPSPCLLFSLAPCFNRAYWIFHLLILLLLLFPSELQATQGQGLILFQLSPLLSKQRLCHGWCSINTCSMDGWVRNGYMERETFKAKASATLVEDSFCRRVASVWNMRCLSLLGLTPPSGMVTRPLTLLAAGSMFSDPPWQA